MYVFLPFFFFYFLFASWSKQQQDGNEEKKTIFFKTHSTCILEPPVVPAHPRAAGASALLPLATYKVGQARPEVPPFFFPLFILPSYIVSMFWIFLKRTFCSFFFFFCCGISIKNGREKRFFFFFLAFLVFFPLSYFIAMYFEDCTLVYLCPPPPFQNKKRTTCFANVVLTATIHTMGKRWEGATFFCQ